ncbi:MAG: GatB/YqeY domain-containing protein [Patescibacteria group bacterium]|jgi:hypothetical protein
MLRERIEADFLTAMKAHDAGRVSVLRTLRAALQNAVIAARTSAKQELDDADIAAVITQEVKRLKDVMQDFTKAARTDLLEAANSELAILKQYLPEQLSLEAVREIAKTVVTRLRSEGISEFPAVMQAAMAELKGKADGTDVATAVREALTDTKGSA